MSARPSLQQQVDELRAEVDELRRWRASQEQVWSDWREGKAAAEQGRTPPRSRPRRFRGARSTAASSHLSVVAPGGAA